MVTQCQDPNKFGFNTKILKKKKRKQFTSSNVRFGGKTALVYTGMEGIME